MVSFASLLRRRRGGISGNVIRYACGALIFCLGISTAYASSFGGHLVHTVFTGYGSVDVAENSVSLKPMVSTSPVETHAGLVVSEEVLDGDYEVSFTVENIEQLRVNSAPNAWEAPWFVFGYNDAISGDGSDDQTFTYVIFKPDGYGLELGEAYVDDGQNFLWTSSVGADSFEVGVSYDVVVRVENDVITLKVDDVEKFVFSDTGKRTLDLDGRFGFYTEDAEVRFSHLNVVDLDDSHITEESSSGGTSVSRNVGGVVKNHSQKEEYVKRAYNVRKPDRRYLQMRDKLSEKEEVKDASVKLYSVDRGNKLKRHNHAIQVLKRLEELRRKYLMRH